MNGSRFVIGFDIDYDAVTRFEPKRCPDAVDPRGQSDAIEFRWNRWTKELRHCDTVHLLYLLQSALDLHRQWVIERNQYFASILRTDRFIEHVDGPQIVTNILKWFNEDKHRNVLTGEMVLSDDGLSLVRNVLCDVGMLALL